MQNRDQRVTVNVTQDDLERIRAAAERAGLTISDFIRRLLEVAT
jgi:predicted DNA binding CopG/RHH family protein